MRLTSKPVQFNDDLCCHYGQALTCPACGESDIHHSMTTVYDRHEDGARTMVTEVSDGGAIQKNLPSEHAENPSVRRDGIAIRFFCEHCPTIFELTFAQHKGVTFVKWRQVGWVAESWRFTQGLDNHWDGHKD